jgi:hypothetical protein
VKDAEVFGGAWVHRVTLYIPSTADVDEPLTESAAKEVVNRAQRFMATLFGGATVIAAAGSWMTEDGQLVSEPITLVYSFTDTLTTDVLVQIRAFAAALKAELKQEAIAVEIDGGLHFV